MLIKHGITLARSGAGSRVAQEIMSRNFLCIVDVNIQLHLDMPEGDWGLMSNGGDLIHDYVSGLMVVAPSQHKQSLFSALITIV